MRGMEGEMLKGHLDLIVLAALSGRPAHGYAVIEEIRPRFGRHACRPACVFPTDRRLTHRCDHKAVTLLGLKFVDF